MNKQEFEYLLKKYFQETLSPEEEKVLIDILTDESSQDFLDSFDAYYQAYSPRVPFSEEQKKRIWDNIVDRQSKKDTPKYRRTLLKYAAILIVLSLSISGIYWQWFSSKTMIDKQETAAIAPIYLRSYSEPLSIILENGRLSKELADDEWSQYGLVIGANNVLIVGGVSSQEDVVDAYLRISTEKGQVQELVLPDGSHVWINSKSELRIPLSFSADHRTVQMVGEAYFEVASRKDSPFQVITEHNTTEVLGTHFNISAHREDIEETTLVEGAVRVSNDYGMVLLSPGEQAFGNQKPNKHKVDIEKIMAWKYGDFYFDDYSIQELMDVVEEWYDIQFVKYQYESHDRFSGIFRRTNSLEDLLHNLEEVSSIKFNLKEGGVYVLKK